MKPYEVKYCDKDGKKEQRRFQNGIVETLLGLEVSQWYIDNRLIPAQQARQEEEEHIQHEIKIQQKLREMAEEALAKEEV